ncbi:MAG: CBS domain-containing protein [Pyrinomonadaceae bacterium]|nr:CBS domain-containing protein [Pyrinomonadaceae bacterium]
MICPSCGHDNIEGVDSCENCMKPLRDLDVPRADATSGLVRSVMEDELGSLERREYIAARVEEPAIDVVRRMKELGVSCALVFDPEEKLAGIFTAQDALRKLGVDLSPAQTLSVGEAMTPKPEALRETDSIAAAFNKMSIGDFRHVPVLTEAGDYRIVSVEHLLDYIAHKEW